MGRELRVAFLKHLDTLHSEDVLSREVDEDVFHKLTCLEDSLHRCYSGEPLRGGRALAQCLVMLTRRVSNPLSSYCARENTVPRLYRRDSVVQRCPRWTTRPCGLHSCRQMRSGLAPVVIVSALIAVALRSCTIPRVLG